MSPLSDHEIWLSLVHFCFFFLYSVFLVVFLCFFGCLPLFSMNILGAWHYVYHQLMMLKIGFSMLLELDTQVWKKRADSVISNEIIVSWNDRLVLRHELLENNEYMVWVFIEAFSKFGWTD